MGALTPRSLRAKELQGDNPYQREHDDLMASILGTGPYRLRRRLRRHQQHDRRHGPHGHLLRPVVTWDEATPLHRPPGPRPLRLDADPPTLPDAQGCYPIPIPGVTVAF